MPDLLKRLDARAERGFSMFLVIMAMFVTAMFVAAAFAAANGDLPVAGVATERKSDYAAAEAGVNYYLNRLQLDPDYWTKCDTASPLDASDPNPVNQLGASALRWRTIPDATDQYTIELIPAKGFAKCDTANQWSFVDKDTGTFKIRVTGRASSTAKRTRSIIATFRRESFLNFIYFTNYENRDPLAEASKTERERQSAVCADKVRSKRVGQNCVEIQFAEGDAVNGPLHSNDESVLICNVVTFGRATDINLNPRAITDVAEVRGPAPGYEQKCTSTTKPKMNLVPDGKFTANARMINMPQSNAQLQDIASASSSVYTGLTWIRLNGDQMTITNNGDTTTKGFPSNGVLYVENGSSCTGETPTMADQANEPASCGNVYVSGSYSKSLTIAAENDVVITPTQGATGVNASDITQASGSDAVLGLIANNFVRVGHKVQNGGTGCTAGLDRDGDANSPNLSPVFPNIKIEAAILALQHSFIVDNYQCGGAQQKLTVIGAIVQKYRGPVGTGGAGGLATGYYKNYWYDDRFQYRSPPYFLSPVSAGWDIVRQHEVVTGS